MRVRPFIGSRANQMPLKLPLVRQGHIDRLAIVRRAKSLNPTSSGQLVYTAPHACGGDGKPRAEHPQSHRDVDLC